MKRSVFVLIPFLVIFSFSCSSDEFNSISGFGSFSAGGDEASQTNEYAYVSVGYTYVTVHFDNSYPYSNPYIWVWYNGEEGTEYAPAGNDSFGPYFRFMAKKDQVYFKFKDGQGIYEANWESGDLDRSFKISELGKEVWVLGGSKNVYPVNPFTSIPDEIVVHLETNSDFPSPQMWLWYDDGEGQAFSSLSNDDFGLIYKIIPHSVTDIGFKFFQVSGTSTNWESSDRKFSPVSFPREVWVKVNDATLYTWNNTPTNLTVHYDNVSNYSSPMLWYWYSGFSGTNLSPEGTDSFGPYYVITFKYPVIKTLGFKFNDGGSNWDPYDRYVSLSNTVKEIWATARSGDVYYSNFPRTIKVYYKNDELTGSPVLVLSQENRILTNIDSSSVEDGFYVFEDVPIFDPTLPILVRFKSGGSWESEGFRSIMPNRLGSSVWIKSGDPNFYFDNPDKRYIVLNFAPRDTSWTNVYMWLWYDDEDGIDYEPVATNDFGYVFIVTPKSNKGINIKFKNGAGTSADWENVQRYLNIDTFLGQQYWTLRDVSAIYDYNPGEGSIIIHWKNVDNFQNPKLWVWYTGIGGEAFEPLGSDSWGLFFRVPKIGGKDIGFKGIDIQGTNTNWSDSDKYIYLGSVSGNDVWSFYGSSFVYDYKPAFVVKRKPAGTYPGVHTLDDRIVFSVYAPYKREVKIVGSWITNSDGTWKTDSDENYMYRDPDGTWWKDFKVGDGIAGRIGLNSTNRYAYVFDGNWISDPYSTEVTWDYGDKTVFYVKNGQVVVGDYNWKYDSNWLPPNERLVIYEIHVNDFTGGEGEWDSVPSEHYGKFLGVVDKLDYLKNDLNVNAIYLMPIMEFPGDVSWGYNTAWYMAAESAYGVTNANKELKILIDEAHKRGIRVILDVVLNHAHFDCPLNRIDYGLWFGGENPWGMPDFAYWKGYNSPPWNFARDVLMYWIDEFHIDGFRFDATRYIDNYDFLGWVASEIHNHGIPKPFVLIAEHLPMDAALVNDRGFDAEWNDTFHDQMKANLREGVFDGKWPWNTYDTQVALNNRWSGYGGGFTRSLGTINYVESHDEQRIIHEVGTAGITGYKAFRKSTLGWAAAVTAVGAAMMYHGQEFGEYSERTIDVNKIHWYLLNNPDWGGALRSVYSKLNYFKANKPALWTTNCDFIHVNDSNGNFVIAYKRWDDSAGNYLVVVLNFKEIYYSSYTINGMPFDGHWKAYYFKGQYQWEKDYYADSGSISIGLPEETAVILEKWFDD